MPNASVLPVPVRDRPITSRPARTGLKASACTGVNCVIPFSERTSITCWDIPDFTHTGLDVERNAGFVKSSGFSCI